jgi:hypothetical protein
MVGKAVYGRRLKRQLLKLKYAAMEKTIFNCHTHTFTIDHVLDKFGKKLLPLGMYHLLTMKFIKWYYENLTGRKNIRIRKIQHLDSPK